MRKSLCTLSILLLVASIALAADAAKQKPAFQYKHQDIEVPAAAAAEPKVKAFNAETVRAAVKYLDDGAHVWARERSCVACHTTGPYLVERPGLARLLGTPSDEVRANFIQAIPDKAPQTTQRDGETFYPAADRAVWRSAGLAEWDKHVAGKLSEHTERSLRDMLMRQSADGRFTLVSEVEIPHVTSDFELTLHAARAVTAAPGWLANLKDAELLRRVELMKTYLREDKPRNDYDRVLRLQLATWMPELVSAAQREAAMAILWQKQLPDGGWSTRRMSDVRSWRTPMSQRVIALIEGEPDAASPGSDPYMTALAIVLLREAGAPAGDARIRHGIAWLKANQRASGRWWMKSLYRDNHHYITYIATVQALKALALCGELAQNPPRLKRAESFLGIHFDFHANTDCREVGKNTTPAMIENIIDLVHPDYLQIDCKGHPGVSSYPTKVGNPAPGIVGDPLRVWREVTARRGVGLYMHYSGVWDSHAVQTHPDWAVINADGKLNARATSFFGPYAEKLLIPQLGELAGQYGVDGAWVDGECWASVVDYSPAALAAFQKATGIRDVPRKPGQPGWIEFLDFHRECFRKYLRRYIAEVNKSHPQFQICSNWAFTDHMAEPVSAPVAFLSGDYSPQDSVNSARLSARYLVRQGVPWDLMAWSFTTKPDRRQKTAMQLQREAAVVVALGGGFQAYYKQKRDGSIFDEQMPVMAEVAKFCRARQALCHHAMPVPQIALLLSTDGHYRKINTLFGRDLRNVSGTLQALLAAGQSVEVLGEHQLAGRMAEYPLIIVPEWEYLEPRFKIDLAAYARQGGNLLLVGPKTAALFATELGVALDGEVKPNKTVYLAHKGALAALKSEWQAVKLGANAAAYGQIHQTNDGKSPGQPAASIAKLGRGQIAATYFTFGQGYAADPTESSRRLLNDLARRLFPAPMVEVAGSSDVDVCVARNHGKLLVNLVNTAGPHRTQSILESIPPVGPLAVSIRHPAKPAKVTLEPAGQTLPFEYREGKIRLTVPEVKIHEAVVVQQK